MLDSTDAFELLIADERSLPVFPDRPRFGSGERRAKGRQGWRFTLHAPDYFAVMTYLDDASIRRHVYQALSVRAAGRLG